jgi:hypothetical protein
MNEEEKVVDIADAKKKQAQMKVKSESVTIEHEDQQENIS